MKTESPYAPFYPVFRKLLVVGGVFAGSVFVAIVVLGRPEYEPCGHAEKARHDLLSLRTMLLVYERIGGVLPSTAQGLAALVEKPSDDPLPGNWKKLMADLPVDPWDNGYIYECPARRSKKAFDLYSLGPDRLDGTADDIGNWEK